MHYTDSQFWRNRQRNAGVGQHLTPASNTQPIATNCFMIHDPHLPSASPNSLEIITNEVFRWDVTSDDFIFSGKSYVLEKIMVKINFSQDDMRRELRTRKRILEWMVLNDIRKADQVSQIVTEYYVRPTEILARVDGLR